MKKIILTIGLIIPPLTLLFGQDRDREAEEGLPCNPLYTHDLNHCKSDLKKHLALCTLCVFFPLECPICVAEAYTFFGDCKDETTAEHVKCTTICQGNKSADEHKCDKDNSYESCDATFKADKEKAENKYEIAKAGDLAYEAKVSKAAFELFQQEKKNCEKKENLEAQLKCIDFWKKETDKIASDAHKFAFDQINAAEKVKNNEIKEAEKTQENCRKEKDQSKKKCYDQAAADFEKCMGPPLPPTRTTGEDSDVLYNIDLVGSSIIKIYPNPTPGPLSVEYFSKTGDESELLIYDFMGRLMLAQSNETEEGINTFHIDFSNLNSGIYLLEIKQDNLSSRMKIMIQK